MTMASILLVWFPKDSVIVSRGTWGCS